jgi:DNA-binding PadR family transcriptional regulator
MRTAKSEPQPETFLPLTPTWFEILLALVDGELHGYAIMRAASARTGSEMRLLPGTLYRALTRMADAGLVALSDERPAAALDDERRRYYRLTDLGRRVLEAEALRLADQVKAARAKKLLQNPKRA